MSSYLGFFGIFFCHEATCMLKEERKIPLEKNLTPK